jgi:hypothetical protein
MTWGIEEQVKLIQNKIVVSAVVEVFELSILFYCIDAMCIGQRIHLFGRGTWQSN